VVKPGYKRTEVGVIPEDWVVLTLSSVTPPNVKNGIVDGPFGSNLKTIHYRNSGIPIISSGYVTDGKFLAEKYLYVDQSKFDEEKRSAVRPGDIVMAKIGERCGASAMLPSTHEVGILSGNALKITVDSMRHSAFYIWQILWDWYCSGEMDLLKTVGAQPAISMAYLKKHKIALPPTKAEQEAIAEALSDADAFIDSLEQLIAKKRRLKQGAMQELLTGKKRLPGFKGEWTAKKLGEVANIKTGSRNNQDKIEDGQYPFFVRSATVERINSYSHDCEAILVPGEGGIGNIFHYIDGRFDVHQRVYAITQFLEEISGKYVYFHLVKNFGPYAMQNSVKATVDSLRLPTFQNFEMDMPPSFAEQTAIAAVLSDMDAEIAALEQKLAKAQEIKQGMMQELLTGKTRLPWDKLESPNAPRKAASSTCSAENSATASSATGTTARVTAT
jgi:type I restriction enzyme S subunit